MPAFYHLGRTAALADSNLARGEESLKKYLGYTPKENEPALANATITSAHFRESGKKRRRGRATRRRSGSIRP